MNPSQARPLVLVTHDLPEEWIMQLTQRCEVMIGPADTSGFSPELEARLGEAQGLLTLLVDKIDPGVLDRAPALRVISNMAVGVDNIDLAACTQRGIPVGNTPGVLTDATADLAMAILLAAARRLPEAAEDARSGRWKTWAPAGWLGADLNGTTLGIVGMGKIGSGVARRAFGFGMKILYTDEQPNTDAESVYQARRVSLEELIGEADFISLHVPLTPKTYHLFDAALLHKMKKSAILVNAARGPVVDMMALCQALKEGWIAAAALDVTEPEPLPPDHPLYTLSNCLIVPHIGSATHGTRRKMAEIACENILAGLAGHPIPFCANPGVYGE